MSNLIKIFKALSDSTRIDILRFLSSKKELSCGQLSKKFPLSQPALSHHFNKLIDANIITQRKDGVSHFYSVNQKFLRSKGFDIIKITRKEAN